jgi:membrane associated rhomboid family serine protease
VTANELPPPVLPRCYRHPDVATGRSCTRCGRPACGDCLRPAAIGSQCPDCLRAALPAPTVRAKYWSARQHALVSRVIIVLNVLVFLWVLIGNPGAAGGFGNTLTSREIDLGLNRDLLAITKEWYRLVTAGFLHFGILHLGMNMFLLFQLGDMLERPLGRLRFGLLYGACLLGGSLGVLVIEADSRGLHGGASGAVFGLMAAATIGMYRRGVNVFQSGIGTLLVINLVLTFAIPGISIGGHLGGAITGAICGVAMLPPPWKRSAVWPSYAVPALSGVVAIVASVLAVT